jgi:hypothetical protein
MDCSAWLVGCVLLGWVAPVLPDPGVQAVRAKFRWPGPSVGAPQFHPWLERERQPHA